MKNDWFIYILRCADGTLYTGITKDLDKRLAEHNAGNRQAAKYTRTRLPVELVYHESCDSRASATRREMAIKRLSRKAKLQLIGCG